MRSTFYFVLAFLLGLLCLPLLAQAGTENGGGGGGSGFEIEFRASGQAAVKRISDAGVSFVEGVNVAALSALVDRALVDASGAAEKLPVVARAAADGHKIELNKSKWRKVSSRSAREQLALEAYVSLLPGISNAKQATKSLLKAAADATRASRPELACAKAKSGCLQEFDARTEAEVKSLESALEAKAAPADGDDDSRGHIKQRTRDALRAIRSNFSDIVDASCGIEPKSRQGVCRARLLKERASQVRSMIKGLDW